MRKLVSQREVWTAVGSSSGSSWQTIYTCLEPLLNGHLEDKEKSHESLMGKNHVTIPMSDSWE